MAKKAKANLPKSVRIGLQDYAVKVHHWEHFGDKDQLGVSSKHEQVIHINKDLTVERQEEIFVHEMLHMVLEEAGLCADDNHAHEKLNPMILVFVRLLEENDFNWLYKGKLVRKK